MGATGGNPKPMTSAERAISTSMDSPEGPIEPKDSVTVLTKAFDPVNSLLKVSDFLVEVAKGTVPGHSVWHKFGRNEEIDTANDADVWDRGRVADAGYIYTYPTTARVHNLASTSANDAYPSGNGARRVQIIGLDINFDEQSEIVNLNGNNNVPTVYSYTRIFRMIVIAAGSSGANAGNITATAQVDGGVSAQISIGNNQTLMAIFTIPNGKTGYMLKYYISINKRTLVDADLFLLERPENQVFQVKHVLGGHGQGGTPYTHNFQIPRRLEAKTDIRLRASVSANDADVSGGFEVLLVDNT